MSHFSVLLQESLDALHIQPEGVYLDATVGAGGHTSKIAEQLTTGRVIGLDRDPETLANTRERLKPFGDKVILRQSNFVNLKQVLKDESIASIDGALFDLGVSSMQLDQAHRGFSFQQDGPLDMRMGPDAVQTAAGLIDELSQKELEHILRTYGEERLAKKIAGEMVKQRPFQTTLQLAELIESVYPAKARRQSKIHPATRSFQALRIAVNDELNIIPDALQAAFDCLNIGGRLAVIAFHSLEDRLVKQFFRKKAQGCVCPPKLPQCVCGKTPQAALSRLVKPSEEEIEQNPRSRSARLRALEKILDD